ncbi:hypothetical protein ACPTKN_13315 [Enterococcus faecalis]|uniref:hypothetical protein n=1 Tax=Enterococcus faecalis TaxID=1351 RepID=UPI003CC5A372
MDRLKIFALTNPILSMLLLLLTALMTLTFIGTVSQESRLFPIENQIKGEKLLLPVIRSKDNLTDEEILTEKQKLYPFMQKDFPSVKDILSVEKREEFLKFTVVFQDKDVRTIAYPLRDVLENIPKLNETYKKNVALKEKQQKSIEKDIEKLEKQKQVIEKRLTKWKKYDLVHRIIEPLIGD